MQALAVLLAVLLLVPTSVSADHSWNDSPFLDPGSSGSASTCQVLRQAWVRQCGPLEVPWFLVNGHPGMPMQYPFTPGQLLGDMWTTSAIIGPHDFKGTSPHWPTPDLAGSFVVFTCSPGISIVRVNIPLRWELMAELSRQRHKRALAERLSEDALPGFFQWLLTAPAVAICPISTLDLVRQTRDNLMSLSKNPGQIEVLLELFESYVASALSTPNTRRLP